MKTRSRRTLRIAAIVAVAGTMRAPITSIPPQIESLRAATGLSLGQFGLLTTIPLLCFAIAAPLPTTGLVRRFAPDRVVLAALLVLTVATAMRPLPSMLFPATLLIGSSIAVLNVTTPVIVRRDFPGRVPMIMSVYSAVLAIIATAGAGLAVPVSTVTTGDWRGGATVWAGVSTAVALVWVIGMRFHGIGAPATSHPDWRGLLHNRTAWMVTVFMGTQSCAFYGGVTWLPQLLRDQGHSAAGAGAMLAYVTGVGFLGSLVIPLTVGRGDDQRWPVLVTSIAPILGFLGVALLPTQGTLCWLTLIGIGHAGLPVALVLITSRAPSESQVGALSSMSQGFGYAFAAAIPVLLGVLHEQTGSWAVPMGILAALSVAELWAGLSAARPSGSKAS